MLQSSISTAASRAFIAAFDWNLKLSSSNNAWSAFTSWWFVDLAWLPVGDSRDELDANPVLDSVG